ncbi:UNKNOWN [Stylonychia lemnae]|uniref:Uncharacterized protein n=1 Tax=Stylonychia lemnae TaxID=5949 RepID=A0A078B1R3_STYLE|nr:UNKNOWN [Stylonychia lemnae]|eukprot:CDW87218.1 UNKNOWN [Stylonychia lemnae]
MKTSFLTIHSVLLSSLLFATAYSTSPLRSHLKQFKDPNALYDLQFLIYPNLISEEAETLNQNKLDQTDLFQRQQRRVRQPPTFIDYQKGFSQTPYYDYLDNFLLGLKIETDVPSSSECVDALVFFLDDVIYFQNNITAVTNKIESWEAPLMNFSRMVGGNLSEVPFQCHQFAIDYWSYTKDKYSGFAGNVGNILLAFLFNLMGNSLKLRQAITDINNDIKNQFYTDIAQQYGKIIRLILDFSADDLTAASLSSSQQESIYPQNQIVNLILAQLAYNVIPNFIQPMAEKKFRLKEESMHGDGSSLYFDFEQRFQDFQENWEQQITSELNKQISSFTGLDQAELLDLENNLLATFNGATSALQIGAGLINGMINVLPTKSFLRYCRDNVTAVQTNYKTMVTKFKTTNDDAAGLSSLSLLMQNVPGIAFNCYYSIVDPTNSGTTEQFSLVNIGWNILYNLGYMYSDIKNSIDVFQTKTDRYYDLGKYIGDFIMRFFYSRYNKK